MKSISASIHAQPQINGHMDVILVVKTPQKQLNYKVEAQCHSIWTTKTELRFRVYWRNRMTGTAQVGGSVFAKI